MGRHAQRHKREKRRHSWNELGKILLSELGRYCSPRTPWRTNEITPAVEGIPRKGEGEGVEAGWSLRLQCVA